MATDLEKLTILIEANTKQYATAMAKLQKDTNRAINASTKSVAGLDRQFKAMSATAQRALGIFGVSFGAAAFVGMVKGAVEAASKIQDLSEQLGISAEEIQKLSFAAEQNGSSQEGLVKSFTAMTKLLGEAERGSKSARAEFTAIGLSWQDLQAKSPAEAFEILLDRIGKIENPLKRNAELIKFFGKSGVEMAGMARLGADGIDKLKQKAVELGLVLTNKEVAALEEAGDKMALIGSAAETAGGKMAAAFLPAIDALAKLVTSQGFQEGLKTTAETIGSIVKWMAEHPELIKNLALAAVAFKAGGPAAAALAVLAADAYGNTVKSTASNDQPFASDFDAMNQSRLSGATFDQRFGGPVGKVATSKEELAALLGGGKKGGGGGAPRFTDPEVDKQAEKYKALAAALDLTFTNLQKTDREQFIANEQAKLGAQATAEQTGALGALAAKVYDGKRALEDFNTTAQFFGSTMENALEGLILRGESAEDVLRNLVAAMAQAALQASLLGSGPLAALFGTAPAQAGGLGGILGSLFGGFRASGGPVMSGKAYMVGEKGPEMFIPGTSGRVAANSNGGGGRATVVVNNYVGGDVQQRRERGPDGERIIVDILKKATASGQLDGANRSRYGLRARKVS